MTIRSLPLIALLCLSMCHNPRGASPEMRAEVAAESQSPVVIGVAWPSSKRGDLFVEGVKLAVAELNAAGGVLGRPVQPKFEDDQSNVVQGKIAAQTFADDINTVAVIGHANSFISIPASVIYEYYGILMLSPASTDPALTTRGFKYIFRSVATDHHIGGQAAEHVAGEGYDRAVVLFEKGSYGRGLANAFENRGGELDLTVVDRISYDSGGKTYRSLINHLPALDFDVIFLAGDVPETGLIAKQLRELGLTQPIVGGDGLDSNQYIEIGGPAVEGSVILTHSHMDNPRPKLETFKRAFAATYQAQPDTWAAQGYDAVHVLAAAMNTAGTTVPEKVAATLKSDFSQEGVTGDYRFNPQGDVSGKRVVRVIVRDGRFHFLSD